MAMADADLSDMAAEIRVFAGQDREVQARMIETVEERIRIEERKLACMLVGAAAASIHAEFPTVAVLEFEVREGYEDDDEVTLLAAFAADATPVELKPDYQADAAAISETQRLLGRSSSLGIRFASTGRRGVMQILIGDPLACATFEPAQPVL